MYIIRSLSQDIKHDISICFIEYILKNNWPREIAKSNLFDLWGSKSENIGKSCFDMYTHKVWFLMINLGNILFNKKGVMPHSLDLWGECSEKLKLQLIYHILIIIQSFVQFKRPILTPILTKLVIVSAISWLKMGISYKLI